MRVVLLWWRWGEAKTIPFVRCVSLPSARADCSWRYAVQDVETCRARSSALWSELWSALLPSLQERVGIATFNIR
jgi:hypothetical protein